MLNDLLDYTEIRKFKQLKINAEEFKIKDLIEDIIKLYQQQLFSKELELRVSYESICENTKMCNDYMRIKQVLINLVGNSVKFTRKGTITLIFRQKSFNSNILQIEVRDTGCGIAK